MAKQGGTNHLPRDEIKMITLLLNIYRQPLYADYIRECIHLQHLTMMSGEVGQSCSILSSVAIYQQAVYGQLSNKFYKSQFGTPHTRKSLVKGERFV